MAIQIDKCVCGDVSFEDILSIAETNGISDPEDLASIAGAGINCRLCMPYIRRMLMTGETEFNQIINANEEY